MHSRQRSLEAKKKVQKQGDPVDAEELTRRLAAYLAEQKLKALKQRYGRLARAKGDWDIKSDLHKSGESTPVLESTTIRQDTRRAIHKISGSLIKYQRQLENRFNGSTKLKNHQKSPSSCSQHSMESGMVCERDQGHWDHNAFPLGDLKKDFCQPEKREFRFKHAFLKSQDSWRDLKTQDQAHVTPKVKKPNKPCHKKNNANWLSRNKVVYRNNESPTPSLRKMDFNWTSGSKKISGDQSLDDISVGATYISQLDSKPGLRENIVALFRKNSHI